MSLLYIILPVHNRKDLTLKFVRSLLNQSYTSYELIVVDDGSEDGTSDEVLKLLPQARIIKGKGDWWWAGSLQQGFNYIKKNARPDSSVLIINDDVTFDKDYLETGINYLSSFPEAFVLSASYNQEIPGQLEDCGVIYDFSTDTFSACNIEKLNELNCLSTRGLFMRTKTFLKTGGFYPKLLPHYYSDYEFTIRAARKYGIQLKCFLDLKVYLNVNSTGVETLSYKNTGEYFRKAFTKRYKENPYYTFNYYCLAFPFPFNVKFAFKTVINFIKTFLRLLLR